MALYSGASFFDCFSKHHTKIQIKNIRLLNLLKIITKVIIYEKFTFHNIGPHKIKTYFITNSNSL
jgi:hypothetical protein